MLDAVKEQALALPREARAKLLEELRLSLVREPLPDPVTPRVFTAAGMLGLAGGVAALALGVVLWGTGWSAAAASSLCVGALLVLAMGFLLHTGLALWSEEDRLAERDL